MKPAILGRQSKSDESLAGFVFEADARRIDGWLDAPTWPSANREMQDPAFDFDHGGHKIEVKLNGEWWDGEIRDAAGVLIDAFSYIHEGDYPGDLRAALNYSDRDGLIRELWLQVWRHDRGLEDAPAVSVELSGDVVTVRRYHHDNLWVGEIRKALVRYIHAPRQTDAQVETAAVPEASRGVLAVKLWDAVAAKI